MKTLAVLLALTAPLSAQAAETGELVRFVTCPVYRDTDSGRKSGCWLADDREGGQRYDVSLSPYKPDWSRSVLVEGRLSAAPTDPCGSPVLDPVRTSVLDQPCPRHLIPAEGHPGRRFVLPKRNISPGTAKRPDFPGPYANRTFALFYEFDRAFLVYQYSDYLLEQAWWWMEVARPKKVIVTGYAATRPITVSGLQLAERPEVAQERADMVAESLHRLMPRLVVETRVQTDAEVADLPDADGIPGQSQRRAEILAVF